MSATVTRDTIFSASVAGLVWRADHAWSMAAEETKAFGFVVPLTEIVALAREYFTNSTGIKVDLYQAGFTGGEAMTTVPRRLKYRGRPVPVQFYSGVTPGPLTDRITGFQAASTNSVRVGLRGDLQPFVHDSLTSYVIVIKNTGVGSQLFSFAVDFRLMFPGEDE
jgi:hypothetical protein